MGKKPEEHHDSTGAKENAQPQAEIVIPLPEYQRLVDAAALANDYYDQLLRTQADFENFKKRNLKEKEQFLKFANEELIYELIAILDSFELAFASANKMTDYKSLHQGVEMILKQLHQLLEKNGVKKIDCLGKPFDPLTQEAVARVETEEFAENTVVEEVQKGYTVDNRVIRPAVVKVAQKVNKEEKK
ncbi:MAG: nucleotide exchange factor GrpE [Candidatus Omnitrophota bacterium]